MIQNKSIKIRTDEKFETLPRAPIVEAVLDIHAAAAETLAEAPARADLEKALTDYQYLDSQRGFQSEVKIEPGKPPSPTVQDLGWTGLRFQSVDKKHIGQFNREGFVFSRLEPYVDWPQLVGEGLRLWNLFCGLARPTEINRIGLRFINRIALPPGEVKVEDYIQQVPTAPQGLELPFLGYLHQHLLAVPGHPYAVNVIQTIQPPQQNQGMGLILDIDVFTQDIPIKFEELSHRLEEMRWLKDKVFFGSITEKSKEMFR